MAGFRFRLQAVLRLRQSERQERRRALAEAHQAQLQLEQMQAELQAQLAEVRGGYREESKPGPMNVDHLLSAHRYALVLQAQAQGLVEKQQLLAEETARRQQALVEADRQVRVLERLRELQRTEHLREEAKRENKRLDEVAARAAREKDALWGG